MNYSVPPSISQALTYELSLDGQIYQSRVYWNVFGQRLYINISDQYGNSVLTLPLIGSAPDYPPVNLLAGYFTTSTLYYYPVDQVMTVLPKMGSASNHQRQHTQNQVQELCRVHSRHRIEEKQLHHDHFCSPCSVPPASCVFAHRADGK